MPEINKNVGDVYAIEQSLYSNRLRMAGRVDCIAEWNGQLSVIDFKTSTREKDEDKILNYFMQCAAYAEMFEEITGKPINQLVVAITVAEGFNQIFVREKDKYLVPLNDYIERYWNS